MPKLCVLWWNRIANFTRQGEPIRSLMGQKGFTLIELVLVLIIIGILAVFVAPRFMDRQTFDRRGFHDQSLAILRYAQKSAIAQRRNVCVAFGTASISLTIANAAGVSVACTAPNTTELRGPNGESPYSISAPTGIYFTNTDDVAATPINFAFDALGQASVGQTFRISGFSENIIVEQDTGYVHR